MNQSADVIYNQVARYLSLEKPPENITPENIMNEELQSSWNKNVMEMRELVMFVIEQQVVSVTGTVYSLSDLLSAIVDDKLQVKASQTNMQLVMQGKWVWTMMDQIFWGGFPQSVNPEVYQNFFCDKNHVKDKVCNRCKVDRQNRAVLRKFQEALFKSIVMSVPPSIDGQVMPWQVYVFTHIVQNSTLSNSKNQLFEVLFAEASGKE